MSDSSNSSASGGGVGCLTLLGLIFITLKLTHYIDWSWWWVLAPFWGGFTLVIVIILIVLIVSIIVGARKWK